MSFFHFLFYLALCMVFGFVSHVVRAKFNIWPDKIADDARVNIVVSGGYTLWDHIMRTEYDESGYYKIDSARNIRLSVCSSFVAGAVLIAIVPGLHIVMADWIDLGFSLLGQRIESRWDDILAGRGSMV